MGWVKKQSGNFNETFKFKKKGDTLEGVLLSRKNVEGLYKETIVYTMELKDGKQVDFFGSGKLDYLLKDIDDKTKVKIVYLGKVSAKIRVGKRLMAKDINDFDVYIWD